MQKQSTNISLFWLLSIFFIITLHCCINHIVKCSVLKDDRIVFPDQYNKTEKVALPTATVKSDPAATTTPTTTVKSTQRNAIAITLNQEQTNETKSLGNDANNINKNALQSTTQGSSTTQTQYYDATTTTTTTTRTTPQNKTEVTRIATENPHSAETSTVLTHTDPPVMPVALVNRVALETLPKCGPGFILTNGTQCHREA